MATQAGAAQPAIYALPPELVDDILAKLNLWSISQLYKASTRFKAAVIGAPFWKAFFGNEEMAECIVEAVDFGGEIFQQIYSRQYRGPSAIVYGKYQDKTPFDSIRLLHAIDPKRKQIESRIGNTSILSTARGLIYHLHIDNLLLCSSFYWVGRCDDKNSVANSATKALDGRAEMRRLPRASAVTLPGLQAEISGMRARLEVMVNADRTRQVRKVAQLSQLKSLVCSYPQYLHSIMKPIHDEKRRVEEILHHLDDLILQHEELAFTFKKLKDKFWREKHREGFRLAHVSVFPYDSCLWLFLFSMIRLETFDDQTKLSESQREALDKIEGEMKIAADGLFFLYHDGRRNVPRPHDSRFKIGRIEILDFSKWDLSLSDDRSNGGPLMQLVDQDLIYDCGFSWEYYERYRDDSLPSSEPWDDRELQWLDAFLKSVATFEVVFPDLAEKGKRVRATQNPSEWFGWCRENRKWRRFGGRTKHEQIS